MKTMLIDSNFLCHRAKHATIDLTFYGIRTGIIYGFFGQFFSIMEKIEPDLVLFFWDSKKSKRKEIFSGYKYKSKELSEYEIEEQRLAYAQFKQLRKKILPEMGFNNNFLQSGYESDDLIAHYVMNHSEDDNCIVTGDDDLLQLLDYAYIYNTAKKEYTTREDFVYIYQIEPKQWCEAKKIAGCTSDTVPGVQGVGIPTAIKYLRGELKRNTKVYQNIINNKEVIERNHALVVLPFEGTKEITVCKNDFSMIEFLRFCRKFGLNSFRQEEKKEKIRNLLFNQMKGKKNGDKKENSRHNQDKEEGRSRKRNKKESSTKKRRSTD